MDFSTFVVTLNIHHICGACVGFLNMSNYDDATMSFSQRQWLVRVLNVVNNACYSNLSFFGRNGYVLQRNFRHQIFNSILFISYQMFHFNSNLKYKLGINIWNKCFEYVLSIKDHSLRLKKIMNGYI